MKLCKGCMTMKDDSGFPKNPASPDGLHSRCKDCRAQKDKERRARPEVVKVQSERLRKAYIENRDALMEKRRARYQSNRDAELSRNKKWSDANREKHQALNRQWSKKNPDAARALVARRRARIVGAPGDGYSKADINRLMDSQEGACAVCRCNLSESKFHVDHIMPLVLGGANDPSNIQLLCPTCNRSKGGKHPDDWHRQREIR